jgi:hypothetical protein
MQNPANPAGTQSLYPPRKKSSMKTFSLLLLAGGLALGGWRLWAATADSNPPKDWKPVVVVSISGYDKLMDNVAMLGKVSGNPELARELIVILKLIAIQQEMGGPERTRPWGAVLQTDGDELSGCAFIPSANLSKLAAMVEPLVGKAEESGRGIYKVRSRVKPVYVTQRDGWAFFAYSPEALDAVPADPIALLAGLNERYDVAVRIHTPNILPKHREKIIAWLNTQVEPYAEQQQNEPARVYALRKQATDAVLRPALAAVNDAETVTIGWALDNEAQKTHVDVAMTAKAGTETARAMAGVVDVAPVEFSLALGETAKCLAAEGKPENRSMAALAAMALEPSAGRDHVKLIAGPIPQGVQYRFEVEEGVLKLLSRLSTIILGEEKE